MPSTAQPIAVGADGPSRRPTEHIALRTIDGSGAATASRYCLARLQPGEIGRPGQRWQIQGGPDTQLLLMLFKQIPVTLIFSILASLPMVLIIFKDLNKYKNELGSMKTCIFN